MKKFSDSDAGAAAPGGGRPGERGRGRSGLRPVKKEEPMEKTELSGPWRIWVSLERKIGSFHQEAGFQKLEFRTRELFLRCVDRYAGERYRYQ